jgi:hypothetical protein
MKKLKNFFLIVISGDYKLQQLLEPIRFFTL